MSLVGYVIRTQAVNTVKVRVPYEKHLPKYGKSILRHRQYLAHDVSGKCLVGDLVRIEPTPPFSPNKRHAVAECIKEAERYVHPETGFVYTNGHLSIPVGRVDADGNLRNRLTTEEYKEMGLL